MRCQWGGYGYQGHHYPQAAYTGAPAPAPYCAGDAAPVVTEQWQHQQLDGEKDSKRQKTEAPQESEPRSSTVQASTGKGKGGSDVATGVATAAGSGARQSEDKAKDSAADADSGSPADIVSHRRACFCFARICMLLASARLRITSMNDSPPDY